MDQIIESVPNFSEGKNQETIRILEAAVESMPGAKILHIDSGVAASRTVFTIAGTPEAVTEGVFRAVACAAERIDMRSQKGRHPRLGATDVLPLVPVKGISLEECAALARKLARRVGNELGIPVYCYEAAASAPYRMPLEVCRRGEYEGLAAKMQDPQWKPDFGPQTFDGRVARTGATIIGARDFLGAVNFNLASSGDAQTDTRAAKSIAWEIRASSRSQWSLPTVKAIGWHIAEYGFAQVSTNLTDMHTAGLAEVWTAVNQAAARHGAVVTGTEVIGLLPGWALTDAGRKLAGEPQLSENEATEAAIRLLGLDTMQALGRTFDPQEKIVERALENKLSAL